MKDSILVISSSDVLALTLYHQLLISFLGGIAVCIGYDDQECVLLLSNHSQFLWISFSNPLLTRLAAIRELRGMDFVIAEVPLLQKPAHERVGLFVLAN